MVDSYTSSQIYQAFSSFNLLGKIRDAVEPIITALDSVLGYDDLNLCPEKPDLEIIKANAAYVYKEKGKLFYITNKTYDNPIEITEKDLEITEQDFSKPQDTFGLLIDNLTFEKITRLNSINKNPIYKFISTHGSKPGVRYLWHKRIYLPYKTFEDDFIKKYPIVSTIYETCKQTINNICTFAVSETGCRAASIFLLTTTAITSGGIIPAIGVGVYIGAVTLALVQQSVSKASLNRLTEEAKLLEEYAKNYTKKIELAALKNVSFPPLDKPTFQTLKKLKKTPISMMKAIGKHLSTYLPEVAIPVLLTLVMPINGITQGVKFWTFVVTSSLGVGVGAYFRTIYEQQKQDLKTYIDGAQKAPFIPLYKDLKALKELVRSQEIELKALTAMPENLNARDAKINFLTACVAIEKDTPMPKSIPRWKEYFNAFYQVLNPFDSSKNVKDADDFRRKMDRTSMFSIFNRKKIAPELDKSVVKNTTSAYESEKTKHHKILDLAQRVKISSRIIEAGKSTQKKCEKFVNRIKRRVVGKTTEQKQERGTRHD